MAVDVQAGQAHTVWFTPPARWATPTARVVDPNGATVQSPTPVVSSISTTVATASTAFSFTVADATGISPGTQLEVAGDWGTSVVEVAQVDGTTITTLDPLPAAPEVGAVVEGIDVSVPITAISTKGIGYRCILTQGTQEMVTMFDVVRQPFVNPVTTQRVRRYVADHWPSDPLLNSEEDLSNLSEATDRVLRGRLRGTGLYPHLVLDPSSLEEAGITALKLALLDRSRLPGGIDPEDYRRSLNFDLRDRINDISASAVVYDADDDGAVDSDERVAFRSVRVWR